MAFAGPTDVSNAMEGLSPPLPSETRIHRALDYVSARLRILIPDLEARIEVAETTDLAILAKDVVSQAVVRRLSSASGPEAQSTTQQAGPFATTVRFREDKSGTFSDDDLALLRGVSASLGVRTIKLGAPDWVHL